MRVAQAIAQSLKKEAGMLGGRALEVPTENSRLKADSSKLIAHSSWLVAHRMKKGVGYKVYGGRIN
jgi:hypothetical protein